jgi:hypothetical protein
MINKGPSGSEVPFTEVTIVGFNSSMDAIVMLKVPF